MELYFDCASGVSGDMLLGALLDLAPPGVDLVADVVRPALAALGVPVGVLETSEVRRGGIVARAVTVADAPGFATFRELRAAVAGADLAATVRVAVDAVAKRMAGAEACIHGAADEHLHELSAIDTLVDLVSVAALIAWYEPARILSSPPALGNGRVSTAHGLVPVPAPAVLALLQGSPSAGVGCVDMSADVTLGELTTPTGAALLTHYATFVAGMPAGRIVRVGYGAGQRELHDRPNVLRAVLVDAVLPESQISSGGDGDAAHVVLETNIDDMSPELLAHAAAALREAGALDVWLSDALMKKGRPGAVLHVLTVESERQRVADIIFRETSSFGLRVVPIERLRVDERRAHVTFRCRTIAVRLGYLGDRLVTASPEYEDVRRVAAAEGLPAAAVYEAAQAAARTAFGAV